MPVENLPKILSVLELLTEEELIQLNHVVVARLRLMQKIRSHGQMMQFRVGQRVHFPDRAGQIIHGTVARHNSKSVTIVSDSGVKWTVAPSFIHPD